jgi:membrane associated rhomboid family serine protease
MTENLAHRTDPDPVAVADHATVTPIATTSHGVASLGAPAFGGQDGGTGRRRLVVMAIIAVNTLVALVGLVMMGIDGGLDAYGAMVDGISKLHEWGEMDGRAVDDGEVWRLGTSMFVHYGLGHLAVNMLMLGLAGWKLEPILGSRRFLGLYLLSGFAAAVATYLFSHDALTAGASGATFGTFAALFVVCLRLRLPRVLPSVLVLVGVVTTFAIPGMAVAAHVAGLLVGAGVAAGYAYPSGARRTTVQRAVPPVTLGLLVVVAVAAALL